MSENSCIICDYLESGKGPFSSLVIYESEKIFGFLLSKHASSEGHCIFLPKAHAQKMHEIEDVTLSEIVTVIKKVARILELENYNILQNNGTLAFQTLFHTHFHLIPKYAENDGLRHPRERINEIDQSKAYEKIISKLSK